MRRSAANENPQFERHPSLPPILCLYLALLLSPPTPAAEPAPFRNSLGMSFIRVQAGELRVGPPGMGRTEAILDSGNPAAGRTVTIERAFLLCRHETRVADYRAFVEATGHDPPRGETYDLEALRWLPDYRPLADPRPGNDAEPITCVTLPDARAFCAWLSEREGRHYRLPTEVEWEYAARAGSDARYQDEERLTIAVNAEGRVGMVRADPREVAMDDLGATAPISPLGPGTALDPAKGFEPNRFGLFHMLGNAAELVEMTHHPGGDLPLPLPGWIVEAGREHHMLRGGSWLHAARDCTVYRATFTSPPYSNSTIGFRVLLEAGE